MSVKTTMAAVMTAVMALAAPMVYADQGPGAGNKDWHHDGGWQHGHDHMKMLAKILGLSDDQVKQFKDLETKQKDTMKANFEQIKSNREALEAEIVKANPDMSKINGLQTQLKTLQGQMVDSHLNGLMDVKKVMSPEQFAGYMALMKAKHMMMHMHKMHKGSRHGDWGKGNMHKHWCDKDKDDDQGND